MTTPDDRPASDVHINIKVPQRYINMTYDYKKDYVSGVDGIIYVTIPPFSTKSIRIEVSIRSRSRSQLELELFFSSVEAKKRYQLL